MSALDYVIIGIAAVCFVIGLIKGLLNQVFAVGGVFVVTKCSSLITPYTQQLVGKLITDESTSTLVALVLSYIVLTIVWILVTKLITKAVEKGGLGGLNRLLGGIVGIATTYLIFAVVVAFLNLEVFASIREKFSALIDNSWIVKNIYAQNPVGDWIMKSLSEMFTTATPEA